MKTLDTFSKRVLIIAVSASMVLLSASAFVLSMQRATAAPPTGTGDVIGLGITDRTIYYAKNINGTYAVFSMPAYAGGELK